MIAKIFRLRMLIISLIFAALILWILNSTGFRDRQYSDERAGFLVLSEYASQMIGEHHPGVVGSKSERYIANFADFQRFVQSAQKNSIKLEGTSNPFPEILSGELYDTLRRPATQPSDILILSRVVHNLGGKPIQWRMTADGVLHTSDSDPGFRVNRKEMPLVE